MRVALLTSIVLLGACRKSAPAPRAVLAIDAAVAAEAASPPTLALVEGAPPGSSGRCRIPPRTDAGADTPAEIAHCPNVADMMRGDGIGDDENAKLPPVTPSAMPAWDLDGVRDFACAYACAPVGSAAHLLAWNVTEDDRPLRNHGAAFAVEHVGPKPRWSVVVMYRHSFNEWWNVIVSFHRRSRPVRDFDRPPTDAEVYAMLDENDWQFAHEDLGFKVLAGSVIDANWIAVTSQTPMRFFPLGIER